MKTNNKFSAFTLAEVLITMSIIAIVTILAVFPLKHKIDDSIYQKQSITFQRRLGEALKVMNTQGKLGGYRSTEAFVEELGKHIKILNKCSNTELTKCFVDKIKFGNEQFDVSTITTSLDMGKKWPESNVMGLQFVNGISALIAYNTSCTGNQFDNDYITLSGDSTSKKNATVTLGVNDCIAILYDLNGKEKPNADIISDKPKDLRNINISVLHNIVPCRGKASGEVCVTSFKPSFVNCADPTSDGYSYCQGVRGNSGYEKDYWAGAKRDCAEADGGRLPTIAELTKIAQEIYTQNGSSVKLSAYTYKTGLTWTNDKYGINKWAWVMSSEELSGGKLTYYGIFNEDSFNYSWDDRNSNHSNNWAICVGGGSK